MAIQWRDWLLFPLALLFVFFEAVYRLAAQLLLATLAGLPGMMRARAAIANLPAGVVLPLFVVPEAISHLAGFGATYLLARGQFVAAIALAVVVKGAATLATVWIYQAASATLLAVTWFARAHGWAMSARAWTLRGIQPTRMFVRHYWQARQPAPNSTAGRLILRFRMIHMHLRVWLRRRASLR
jgi:hypothetical protein